MKKLITIRQQHSALQSLADIRFVWVKENAYPLAYIRENAEEKILVVLNPSDKEVAFKCDEVSAFEELYRLGGELTVQDGMITIPAVSACWVSIK